MKCCNTMMAVAQPVQDGMVVLRCQVCGRVIRTDSDMPESVDSPANTYTMHKPVYPLTRLSIDLLKQ
jgi:uncharacterized C2H2 Zn-finger protein